METFLVRAWPLKKFDFRRESSWFAAFLTTALISVPLTWFKVISIGRSSRARSAGVVVREMAEAAKAAMDAMTKSNCILILDGVNTMSRQREWDNQSNGM